MLEQERIEGWWSGLTPVLAPGPIRESLYARMGGVLGMDLQDEIDVAFLIQAGIPVVASERAACEIGLPIGYLQMPAHGQPAAFARLQPDVGDRLMRVVRLYAQAVLMLGHEAAARTWLHTPIRWREGVIRASPLQLAARESGARLAEQLLLRAVHGVQ